MPALQHAPDGPPDRQVLVVGTGLAGLVTAVACRARGFDPVVVAGATPNHPPSVVLWRPALALLEQFGAEDALADGVPIRRWVRRRPDGTTAETFVHDAPSERTPCRCVRRDRLERTLAGMLPDDRLRSDARVQRVERSHTGPVVTFEDGVRERVDVVLGADGPTSPVRSAAVADHEDGVSGGGRGGGGQGSAPTVAEVHRPPRLSTRDTVYELPSPDGSLTRLGPLPDADVWRSVRPGARSAAAPERWTAAGLALVGTAANPLPPAVTTRDSLAVSDAATFASVLGSRATTRAALRTYERRRTHRTRDLYGEDAMAGSSVGEGRSSWRSAFLRRMFEGADTTDTS